MTYILSDKLVVAVSSRALFDLKSENSIFEEKGLDAYYRYQLENEEIQLNKHDKHLKTLEALANEYKASSDQNIKEQMLLLIECTANQEGWYIDIKKPIWWGKSEDTSSQNWEHHRSKTLLSMLDSAYKKGRLRPMTLKLYKTMKTILGETHEL